MAETAIAATADDEPDGWTPPRLRQVHPPTDVDTHAVQSAVEGAVQDGDTFTFLGERFRLADNVALMPLLAFANASKKGLDSEDFEGMAAMYALIRSVVHRPVLYDDEGKPRRDDSGRVVCDESEWARFEDHAMSMQAEGEDLMEVVGTAMSVISARPRKRREISSDGSPRTSQRSKANSSSPGTAALDGMVNVADLGR